MDRFEELKAKGFKNLKGAEREEYLRLRPTPPKTNVVSPFTADGSNLIGETMKIPEGSILANSNLGNFGVVQEPTISVTKSELQSFIDAAVAKAVTAEKSKSPIAQRNLPSDEFKEYIAPVKPKHTATLRKWRKDSDSPWGFLVKAQHHKFEYDEDTRRHDKDMYKFTFRFEDGKEEDVLLPYLELTKMNDTETVRILEMPKKQFVKNQGTTVTSFFHKTDEAFLELDPLNQFRGRKVPVEVKMDMYPEGATVELSDGKIINVPVSCLNA
jgi:hypothetical protein